MFTNLEKPVLLIDKSRCLNNIKRMLAKVDKEKSILRPHFKTHNHAEVGNWFAQAGIKKITVSNPFMAAYFVENNWNDITIAFPFNINWLPLVSKLTEKATLNVLVDNADILKDLIYKTCVNLGVFLKINTGYNRTGVDYNDIKSIDNMLKLLNKNKHLSFKGFLTHAGHTYTAGSPKKITAIYNHAFKVMNALKNKYIGDYPELVISYGDTPSCSIVQTLNKFDEYRPGNFVFYDVMQKYIGSCTNNDIAVVLACPVVSINKQRNEIVVHGGAIHLSKDYIIKNDTPVFGEMVLFDGDKWFIHEGNAFVRSLSQEHGIIKGNERLCRKIKPGHVVGILPVHSCLSAFQMGYNYKII
ncbi:MAG: D-threo-3-hydroxyaspartate dehydratase [Bacteroidetes bacterium ADurb.Bin408]|nr:MAG: D-threo-3-hydroxyaspartate dehydratase [Bacteroidetes bacterium ADurb.Bin408]